MHLAFSRNFQLSDLLIMMKTHLYDLRHRIRNPRASTQFQISMEIGFRFVMHRIIP